MSFHLTVAGSLEPLADALAELLAAPHPSADPFDAELVIVPSAGVRSWLTTRLAERLGATGRGGDGIAANVDYRFPNSLLTTALGGDEGVRGSAAETGAWRTDRLTWTIYDELVANGAVYHQPADAVRARAVADLFDRYTLHRQAMVLAWDKGGDELGGGRAVPTAQEWQPELWRAVRTRTGGISDAQHLRDAVDDLRGSGAPTTVPGRIVVFGLSSLPSPHLEVLDALSRSRDVHVLAPTPSIARWRRLVDRLPAPLALPVARGGDEFPQLVGNPLVTDWGRTSSEAHALLYVTADAAGASIRELLDPANGSDPTLLDRVRRDIVADERPPGPARDGAPEERPVLVADDDSIRWHRCHGSSRQVEVLRDAILHLLAETDVDGAPRYQPRDIAVVTPDIARYAPLVDAVFAGDVEHGVPAIPLQVADRTLRQDNRLVDALLTLFELTEGRFRATDLVRFLSSPVVGDRFGLDASALERISEWIVAANVRWGIDGRDLERFGVPAALDAFTWHSAIDRLLLGATLPDGPARLGLGGVPPMPAIEGADLVTAGRLAQLLRTLAAAVERLTTPSSVHDWCAAVGLSIAELFRPSDDDASATRPVDFALSDLAADAEVDGQPDSRVVDPRQLAALLRVRLETGASRPRFGTGAVTLSSLNALRGVPFDVVCVLGLDAEVGVVASVEDLLAARPCIGDRDPRAEQRAQLLDAILAAGDRLLVFSNGRDVRSNAELPPVAVLAELLDVVDATVRSADPAEHPNARDAIAVDHPRQAWSERSFLPGELGVAGPWSFDEGALAAAEARADEDDVEVPGFIDSPLGPPFAGDDGDRVSLEQLRTACTRPVRTLLRDRLGIAVLHDDSDEDLDDAIPLAVGDLEQSALDRSLFAERFVRLEDWTTADTQEWCEVTRRRGAVPPASLGDDPLAIAIARVEGVASLLLRHVRGETPRGVAVRADVVCDSRTWTVDGTIDGVYGDVLVVARVSRTKPDDVLDAWLRLALLTRHDPTRPWRAVIAGRGEKGDTFQITEVALRGPDDADRVLEFAIDMWSRARRDALPFFPRTSKALVDGAKPDSAWFVPGFNGGSPWGDRLDRWNRQVFDLDYRDLVKLPARPDESSTVPRLRWWAERVWSTVDDTATVTPEVSE